MLEPPHKRQSPPPRGALTFMPLDGPLPSRAVDVAVCLAPFELDCRGLAADGRPLALSGQHSCVLLRYRSHVADCLKRCPVDDDAERQRLDVLRQRLDVYVGNVVGADTGRTILCRASVCVADDATLVSCSMPACWFAGHRRCLGLKDDSSRPFYCTSCKIFSEAM